MPRSLTSMDIVWYGHVKANGRAPNGCPNPRLTWTSEQTVSCTFVNYSLFKPSLVHVLNVTFETALLLLFLINA
jgi:hypothetical protein